MKIVAICNAVSWNEYLSDVETIFGMLTPNEVCLLCLLYELIELLSELI